MDGGFGSEDGVGVARGEGRARGGVGAGVGSGVRGRLWGGGRGRVRYQRPERQVDYPLTGSVVVEKHKNKLCRLT